MKLVSYDKCKDCEHYGVWSERCWNVYECPKEVMNDAKDESLSEAKRKEILNELHFIKRQCFLSDGKYYAMQSICDAADKIKSIIS